MVTRGWRLPAAHDVGMQLSLLVCAEFLYAGLQAQRREAQAQARALHACTVPSRLSRVPRGTPPPDPSAQLSRRSIPMLASYDANVFGTVRRFTLLAPERMSRQWDGRSEDAAAGPVEVLGIAALAACVVLECLIRRQGRAGGGETSSTMRTASGADAAGGGGYGEPGALGLTEDAPQTAAPAMRLMVRGLASGGVFI